MRGKAIAQWMTVVFFSLIVSFFSIVGDAAAQFQDSQVCLECHDTNQWLDNNPPGKDVRSRNAFLEYLPLNLSPAADLKPFYRIGQGYLGSQHNVSATTPSVTDDVKCIGCHISITRAHHGAGDPANPEYGTGDIPGTGICGKCHGATAFLATAHGNQTGIPGKFFDQLSNGTGGASTFLSLLEGPVKLRRPDKKTRVNRNQRIEECSVCHSYALEYPRHKGRIAQGTNPTPQVGCSACHDAHIPAPRGDRLPTVGNTVAVASSSGSTVLTVTPGAGRKVSYRNLKPYKINATTGAQDLRRGTWGLGSSFVGPNLALVSGTGTISNGTGTSTHFTFPGGGFLTKVHVHDTLFISGVASATATLPAAAVDAGAPVTVEATLDKAGFDIISVIDDNNLEISPGVVATRAVAYVRATPPPATANLSVSVPFSGSFTFEIRNMNTNSATLCGSCHTQGKYKFTAWGKKQDGTFVDMSSTHNSDVLTQYLASGHANKEAPAFEEFSARPYGSSHATTYPFDMSITGSGGVGSLRNGGATAFTLTQTPNATNAYLGVAGNTFLPAIGNNNFACFQCHNGLATIDYLLDRQGTENASVVWGDSNPTCYTCHDTHADGAGSNVRIPVKLSYNSSFVNATTNPRGGINKMLDGTDIPPNVGKGIICLFCHQGRESGLTVYLRIKAANAALDPYANPDTPINATSGISFANPHYLDSGSILWSKNTWEYFFGGTAQQYYNGIPAHQELNCMGCHMGEPNADNTEGGHTWKPKVETCKQCHGESITSFQNIPAVGDYNGDGTVTTAFEEIGTIALVTDPTATTPTPTNGGTGLFGQLNLQLAKQGIFYNPDKNPYFFTSTTYATSYTAWTTNTLSAAFDLTLLYKSGNCVPYHNVFYGAQILQDSLRALGVDVTAYDRGPTNRAATDYRTIVVNP